MSSRNRITTLGFGRSALAAVLALCIGMFPLAACGAKPAEEASGSGAAAQEGAGEAATLDVASWKTLGDALATRTEEPSYGYDDNYFVCVFDAGNAKIRAVAKPEPGLSEKLGEIDFDDPDRAQKTDEALGGLELVSAEDISGTILSQEELDAYVGKTGQDLYDDGFVFSSYSMYGGAETGATIDKDYFSYEFTFDTTVAEDQTEDEGEALKGATVTAAESFGNLSNMALDPTAVE